MYNKTTIEMRKLVFSIIAVLAVLSCGKEKSASINGTWKVTEHTITDGSAVEGGAVNNASEIMRLYSDGTGWIYSDEFEVHGDISYEHKGSKLYVTPDGEEEAIELDVKTLNSSKLVLESHFVYKGTALTASFTFKKTDNMTKSEYLEKYGGKE